jgi:hypothetical protein
MERAADSVQTLKRGDGAGADAEGLDFIIIFLFFIECYSFKKILNNVFTHDFFIIAHIYY